jgi:hypothetical protein
MLCLVSHSLCSFLKTELVIHPQSMLGIANYMQVNLLIGIINIEFVCHCSRIEFLLVITSVKKYKRCFLIFLDAVADIYSKRNQHRVLYLFVSFFAIGVHKNSQLQALFGSIRNIQDCHKQSDIRDGTVIFCTQNFPRHVLCFV